MMLRALFALVILWLAGCASQATKPAGQDAIVPLQAPLLRATELSDKPVNVSIGVFSSGVAEDKTALLPVRAAETLYLPVVLRNTLVESGYWGAVRVVPEPDPGAELSIEGRILHSDGVQLVVQIRAVDSVGHIWLDQVYRDAATDHEYEHDAAALLEPFEDLFHQIANDLQAVLANVDDNDRLDVFDAATLNYAMALSPQRFSGYLERQDDGTLKVTELPARTDAMYRRVNRIRESENRFIDTVDESYEGIHRRMREPYAYWRRYAYDLILYNREIAGSQKRQQLDNYRAMESVYKRYQDSRLNEDELREMAASFDAEITPTITRLEGQVIELQGSLRNQYEEWRALLQTLYRLENPESGTGS